MLVSEVGYGLQFGNDFIVADKIGEIFLDENSAAIFKGQPWLRDCWNAAMLEFNSETFLVHGLVKAAAFVSINCEARANDCVAFIFENEVRH